jgi:hypothetical protein
MCSNDYIKITLFYHYTVNLPPVIHSYNTAGSTAVNNVQYFLIQYYYFTYTHIMTLFYVLLSIFFFSRIYLLIGNTR